MAKITGWLGLFGIPPVPLGAPGDILSGILHVRGNNYPIASHCKTVQKWNRKTRSARWWRIMNGPLYGRAMKMLQTDPTVNLDLWRTHGYTFGSTGVRLFLSDALVLQDLTYPLPTPAAQGNLILTEEDNKIVIRWRITAAEGPPDPNARQIWIFKKIGSSPSINGFYWFFRATTHLVKVGDDWEQYIRADEVFAPGDRVYYRFFVASWSIFKEVNPNVWFIDTTP